MNRDLLRAPLLRLLGRMVGLVVPAARIGGSAPNRILLIRPDHLGDLLLTGPAIAALRATLPAARLTLLVGPWSLEAARRSVEVDEVRTLAFPGFTRRPKRHALEPYLLLAHEARELRGIFDTALVLRPDHWWGALLALLAGVPRRIGYATPLCAPLLTQALPLPNGAHAVELSLRLVRALAPSTASDPASQLAPRFEVRTEERAWAAERLGGDRWVLIHPGSGAAVKDWPAARWAGVADALAERGWQIALSGGKDDLALPRAVAAAMRQPALELAGATTLGQLGALVERCQLALGGDSGPLHLAAVLGVPTLRLYGPSDPCQFGPWPPGQSQRVLTHQLPCRPCRNLVAPPCGAFHEPPCLLGLGEARVAAAALELLDANRDRR